ncbi:asparagine synthase (glutamine-hydrolyzing) [Marivirga salinae]|uniref:asparagine synthase (glutamine-hydrolyzing) n=1 Tax=Marivirga salinarum TaxID=3059078 RepID=A0AA51N981_9BACT|nr:asparagine synthase (glutamine-hydrolyzing) [Marivirga sp. BDSF4-3]WMN10918.1 asparagine synthase (glutamine-hydrolyzing) [Marivirga sp. BDSF4-3]
MCGILGAWLPKNNITNQDFTSLVDSIYHRGPDEAGYLIENDFYLGMRRLSIIDLAGGQQPVFNEDQSKAVLFNGEIYNYKSLINSLKDKGHDFQSVSDTEVIVHSLEDDLENINQFRGMFAFAYFEREEQILHLFRDRIGVKPLYYIFIPGKIFAFSSEIKGLEKICDSAGIELTVNEEAIYHYLSFANIPQPITIYNEIKALMPGHHLTFDKETIEIEQYWKYNYQPKLKIDFDEAKELIHSELKESVNLRLNSDVPMGLFLSGGLDSSIIAYLAAKELNTNLKTFTIGFPEHKEFDETDIATKTAHHLGLENEILPLEYDPLESLMNINAIYDQPFADPSAIPSVEISKLASNYVKVVLNGDGGDEQFAGYRRYILASKLNNIPNLSGFNILLNQLNPKRRSMLGFLQRTLKNTGLKAEEQSIALTTDMLLDQDKKHIFNFDTAKFSTQDIISNFNLGEDAAFLDQVMHYDRNFNLLNGLLVKMDMATSSASIEGRSPFLDNILFEKSSLLPANFKVKGKNTKYILKELYGEFLPYEVIHGKKRGFEIPLKSWLSKEFQPLINQMKADSQSPFYNYLKVDFVTNLFESERYKSFNLDYLRYSVLILYLWFKEREN